MIVGSGVIPAFTEISKIPVHNLQPGVYNLRYSNHMFSLNENFIKIR
jgi:hypothetical protein